MRRKGTSLVALVALLASGFTFLEAPAPASAAIVTDNLVLNLDASNTSSLAASGATGWNSVSPASSTATSTFNGNAVRATDSTGASLSLDANGDAAVFPAGTARTPGSMTVETWIKPGNLRAGWNVFASRWFPDNLRTSSTPSQDWHLGFYGTNSSNIKLQLNVGNSTLTSTTNFPTTSANKWYHIALTIDASNGNTATLWINGISQGSAANLPHNDNAVAQLHVGDVGNSTSDCSMAGNISRFRIYSSALTSAQLAQNFLTDSEAFGIAPSNTAVPSISGSPKVGKTLLSTAGTWGAGDSAGTTTAYKWQSSANGTTWTDIPSATSSSFVLTSTQAGTTVRSVVTKTNSVGSATAISTATATILPSDAQVIASGSKLTGLTTTVPNDSGTYNVTLASSNLASTILLGTTTGLTFVGGYASTASYMATSLTNAAPIVSFRGTGTAINTALANVTYAGAAGQTDVVKLYFATGSTTTKDTKNYIPIYDNGQLTFHYYAYKTHADNKNLAGMDAALVGLNTTDTVEAPGPWYLVTPRYEIEWLRTKDIVGLTTAFMGGRANANSSSWYWPANTDGYSSATTFGTQSGNTVTATSNIYNRTNTTLPYHSGEPNGGTVIARAGFFYVNNNTLGWDDVDTVGTHTNGFVMETFGTAPFKASANGVIAQTVRLVALSGAPTAVASTILGDTATVSWVAPSSAGTDGITDYQIEYSTNQSTWTTWDHPASTATTATIGGLTPSALYYFRIAAVTTAQGAYSSTATATVTPTTINVVETGGGTSGTDYALTAGSIIPKSSATVNINASAIQTALLTGGVKLAADTVNVNFPLTWSTSQILTLGSNGSSTVNVNQSISTSGTAGGVAISPSTYNLAVKSGATISFTGASSTLTIGGTAYTLIRNEAGLVATTASGNFALAKPMSLTTAYTAAPINVGFTGTFDGLGNSIDGMKITSSVGQQYGLFNVLNAGGVVRNLGITNINFTIGAGNTASAGLAGGSGGGTIDQVWTTGFIRTTTNNDYLALGGIVGRAWAGTLNISRSWSSVNIDSSSAFGGTGKYLEQGGIIGGNENSQGQGQGLGGGVVNLSQVYSTGYQNWGIYGHRGIGGLFGLHYNSSGNMKIEDSYSWATFAASAPTGNRGGLLGVGAGSNTTITNSYQTTDTNCFGYLTPGSMSSPACPTTTFVAGASIPGITGSNWTSTGATVLKNLATPTKPLYVQVQAPTDGSYGTVTYKVLDGNGVDQTSLLSGMNLTVSGTPVYKAAGAVLNASSAKATYSTYYDSGLTLGGSSAGLYTLSAWRDNTSVTISKYPQTVTWTPTTSVGFGSGTFTPSPAPVASGSTTITYSVSSAGTTGCNVNSSTGAVTYTQGGSCAITATAASAGDWLVASDTETFVIAEPATAPTASATTAGSGVLNIGWTAPTVSSSVAITGYTLTYSTNAGMTSPTTVNVGNTRGYLLSGLTSGTTYYFQVRAVSGSTWTGPISAIASATANSTATTINVVATGGGVAGTDFTINGGVVSATGTVNINASVIESVLATEGTVQLAATNVNMNAPISWSSNAVLVLGNTTAAIVNANSTVSSSGATAGVKILPSSYGLLVKSGAYIRLTGATPSFNLGGTAYTVVNTVAGLDSVTASGAGSTWALTAPIVLTASYTNSVKNFGFAGIMDGLGNTVSNMQIVASTSQNSGFYNYLAGATIRNVGFTNINISTPTGGITTRLGAVAGNGSGSGTNTVTQVWATGFINQTSNADNTKTEAGGLFGGATAGTLNISKSWSSVAISTNAPSVGSGGIIGTNVSAFGGGAGSGNTLTISESYSTGNILRSLTTADWFGNAGIIGVSYGLSTTISNTFSWGNLNSTGLSAGTSTAGISGVGTAAVSNSYTTHASCGGTTTNCLTGQTAGAAVTGGTGFTSGVWQSLNGTSLTNVALPAKNLYVKVLAPTDGSYGTIGYQIVDSTGTAQNLSSLSLSVTGTAVYTISSSAARATYPSVAYVSGLTLGGSSAGVYSLSAWITNTSVTITRVPQTITWAPTTAIPFKAGSFTPSTLATALGSPTITYAVTDAGTTGCSVNSTTGVVTYVNAGTCEVTATAAQSTDYLAGTKFVSFVIAAAPTFTIVTTGGGVSGTDYTVTSGVVTAPANTSINASDLQTLLASGSVQLAGSVVVNAPITWSANNVLTLGGTSGNTVTVNKKITASGNTAGLVLKPETYTLDTKSGAAITLSGTTPTLSMGGSSYTLIKSIAELANVTALAADKFALAVPLTYSTTLSASPININFAGTFDGLGNTVNNMKLTYTGATNVGFFKNLAGGTIRNIGITNQIVLLEPATTTGNLAAGGLVGDSTGGTIEGVWTTGFVKVKSGKTYAALGMGGIVGNVSAGTLNVSKTWSSVGLDGWYGGYTTMFAGGLVGGDLGTWSATSATAGGSLVMNEVYSTGDVSTPVNSGTHGIGGLVGLHLGTGTITVTNALSWSQLVGNAGVNFGGLLGMGSGGTASFTNGYSYSSQNYPATATSVTQSNTSWNSTFGAAPGFGIADNASWSESSNIRSLTSLPIPVKNYYVRVFVSATPNGSYSDILYRTINSVDQTRTISANNLTVSGTPVYSVTESAALGTYSVTYVSGLTYGGSGTYLFNFLPYPFGTSVTISKYAQSISMSSSAPTTAAVGSTYTLTGTASSDLAITYSIDGAPSSVCSISGSVVTFNALGTCTINANQAGNTSYLAAPQVQQSAIATVKGTPALAFTSTAPSAAKVGGSTYTPVATSASPATVTYTIDSASSTVCEIAAGIVSFIGTGDCTVNANQVSGTNWNAAAQKSQTFAVSKGVQTITWTSTIPTNAVVGGATYTVSATKSAGTANSVVYSIDSTSSTICLISGAVVSFIGAGPCKVNANLEGDTKYEAATPVQQSITVAKASQTVAITSAAPTNATGNGPTYTVTGTGGPSTSPLVFSADSSSALVCSVSGTTVSFISIGNCVVNLHQAADANYNAATQVQQTIVVASVTLCPSTFSGSTGYCTVQFPRSGTWTVPANVTSIDVLTVGGGGAGGGGADGNTSPGGGGGGQVLDTLGRSVTSGDSLTVTIGAGGTGGGSARAATASNNGISTTMTGAGTTITSRGGGAGGTYDFTNSVARTPGGAGTAGGGGGNGQAGTPPTGGGIGDVSRGGNGISSTVDANLQAGGGGGGAGGNGVSAAGTSIITAGAGGAGKVSTITGLTYGGGGGGAKRQAGSGAAGAAVAGGGAGGLAAAGTAGTANTGGGGGGSAGANNGANGGSGLVVIRYQVTQTVEFTSNAPTGLIHGTSTTYTPTTSGNSSGSSVVVTVDASASSVCSITDGVVSIIGAGTCKLNVNQAASSFYAAATQIQQSFTVAKADQAITFTNNPAAPKVGTTYSPAATTTGDGTVTYTIAAGSISKCSIADGLVTFNAVGTCTILADSAETTNFNAAPQVTKNVSVVKGDQTITFTSAATSPKVNTTYTPTATATGAGNVSFTISSGSCSIADGVVSLSGVGDCVIGANQAGDDNWNAAPQNTQTITVTKGDQTVTFTNTPTAPKVNSTYSPTATSTSGGTVSFSIADASSSVCEISGGVVSFNAAGSCVIYGDSDSSTNWNAATRETKTIAVGKGDQTISFSTSALSPKVGGSYTPAASATGPGSVTFSITSGSCSITDGVVSFSGIGDCVITANQAGDDNWNAGTASTQTVTVAKGDQTITFTSTIPTTAIVDGSTYTIASTGGASGSAVTYSIASASSAVCTISGATVAFITKGSCEILANQAGTNNWNAAPEVSQSISVGEGTQSINFTSTAPNDAVVGGAAYFATATGGASGNSVEITIADSSSSVCSISDGSVTFNAIGDCTVVANQAGNANYLAAPQATQTISVDKGRQVILFTSSAPNDAVVDGSPYSVSAAGGQSGQGVEFSIANNSSSVCSITSGIVSFFGVGDCVVQANQAGSTDWNAAIQATQTFTVGKGSQIVAFTSSAPTGVRVDDSGYFPTASGGASTTSAVIAVVDASAPVCELTDGQVFFNAVGNCVLEVNQASDDNYNAATQVTQTITVDKGIQVLTQTNFSPAQAFVGGGSFTPTFTGGATGNDIVIEISSGSADVCELANGAIVWTGAGNCMYFANQAGDENYLDAEEIRDMFVIDKGVQAITWTTTAPVAAVVGGTTYTPTATGGATGNAVTFRVDINTASVCAMSFGVVRFVGIGTCTVLAHQAGNDNYLAAPQESQTFTVGQGAQTITFTSTIPTAVVDGASYEPTATGGATGNEVTFEIAASSSGICELVFGRVAFQTAGECVIEANQLGNTNYNAAAQETQTITVGKGSQTASFTSSAPAAKVSGTTYSPVVSGGASTEPVALTIAGSSSSICSITNGVVSFQAVGSCVVQLNQAGDTNYNAAPQVTQTLTVTQGTQIVNFTSTPPSRRVVGPNEIYVPTATFGNSGNPVVFSIGSEAASICSISNGTIHFVNPGDCVLHADQAGNDNYTAATRVTQVFDITKGEQVVEFTSTAPTSAVVDGATYTPTGTIGLGSMPGVFSATTESEDICSVFDGVVYFDAIGECVVALNQAGDTQYNAATPKFQTITVGKGSQTITFTSTFTTAVVDGDLYTPTYTDGESINAVQLSIAHASALICEVNNGSVAFHAVGDCVIEARQAGDNNYEAATVVSQTISVAKGNQATLVASSSLASLTLGASTPTAVLTTSGGSGTGNVTWAVTENSAAYCSVAGEVVSGLASGYCDLVATKSGDDNYLEATATLTVVVSTGGQSPVRTSVDNETPTFAEGLNLTLSLDGGDGDGATWFESLTTDVCNTDGGTALNIYRAGTCNVIGHKDGDDNYDAVQDTLSFEIAKAALAGVTINLASGLTYSADGAVTSALSLEGVLSSGSQSYSVTSGTCTIENGSLSGTAAGDCEVTATLLGDDKYLEGTFTEVFTIAKAAQALLTTSLAANAPAAVAWNGLNVTTFDVSGGSGPLDLTVTSDTPAICSVTITGTVITVTGLTLGTCNATVSNAASANYLGAGTLFSVEVLDLADAPTSVAVANAVRMPDNSLSSMVSWAAPSTSATRAAVTGYRVQASTDNRATWTDVSESSIGADATSLSVTVAPWTKYNFRVAATSVLDGQSVEISALNWAYFDLSGDDTPDQLAVGGGAVVLSTTKAATTSGETVYVTGAGFLDAGITSVEIETPRAVFTASIRPAALVVKKVVPATVISDTKLSFVLPKITLPKGVTTLQATVKVLNNEQLRSDPIPLDYIPKKLAQAITVTGLPATKAAVTIGTAVPVGAVTSTGVTPVATATPANVCTASIVANQVTVVPIGRGTCTVSVQAPVTPAYTASTAKVYSYTVKGATQTLLFTNPGAQVWSATPLALNAVATSGLTPVFTSKTTTVCTVSGTNVNMVKAGTCTIAASQPGNALNEPAPVLSTHTQTFIINKATRTDGLTATLSSENVDGTVVATEFNMASALGGQNLTVYLGENPIEIPVALNKREGTVAFTTLAADEAAGRCTSDTGDVTGLVGAIVISDLGSCKVTISLPADAAWNAHSETIVITINAVARLLAAPVDTGGLPEASADDLLGILDPKDPDAVDGPPPVVMNLDPNAPATYSYGSEDGLSYDPVAGRIMIRSTSALVGTWSAVLKSPDATKLWFKGTKTIIVKKKKKVVPAEVATCSLSLTVKKDKRIKKRILRTIGAGCVLTDSGKAAMVATGIQKIKIKYKRTRYYANTGLAYRGTSKAKTRILKPINRTIVLKIGRPSN